ncbi:MAG: peroxiredoxin [Bdellovibrionota bacterium]
MALKKKMTGSEDTKQELTVKTLPKLTLKNSDGDDVSLGGLKGKKVVLFFYPKDNTPGCTMEGQEFNELHKSFKRLNTEIFGVSRDSVVSHDKYRCKFNFTFDLLSDQDEKLCKAFDVIKEKNMYGKKVMGIVRSTFVFDENGKEIAEFRKVKPEGHAQEVLNQIKALG